LLAIACALPILVIFADMVGWLGGALVCAFNQKIGVSVAAYFSNLREMVDLGDVLNGLIKSFVFAVIIGVVSCQQGLQTVGGPRGIGQSVTRAVVHSIVLILILDYFLTRFLMNFDK
ncbi:MAG: MlaE family ABC transporter permease, partial [Limisphaerales bacterium]